MKKWTLLVNALAISTVGAIAIAQDTSPTAAQPQQVTNLETPTDAPVYFVQDEGPRQRPQRPRAQDGQRGQDGERGQRGQRGEGAERRQMDPERMQEMREQFRQQRSERLKTRLGVEDAAEWKVLEEKIDAVTEKQGEVAAYNGMRRGGRGGQGMRGGPGGNAQNQELTPAQQVVRQLNEVLEDENASADAIKTALKNYRESRDRDQKALAAAREELRQMVTVRQEAQLVVMGILE